MKKLIYALLLLVLPYMANAETVTFDLTNLDLEQGAQVPRQTVDPLNLVFSAGNYPQAPRYRGDCVRMMSLNEIRIDISAGTITNVVLTVNTDESLLGFTTPEGQMSGLEWTGGASKVTIVNEGRGSVDVTSVTVTYNDAPAVSPASGTYYEPQTITIPVRSGKAYYTVTPEGEEAQDPTAESTEYTAPFVLDYSATVKAIIVNEEGKSSPVTTREYKIVEPASVATFEAALAAEGRAKFSEPMTVIFHSDTYIYAKINDSYGIIYGRLMDDMGMPMMQTFQNGDVLKAGIQVERDNANGWLNIIGGVEKDAEAQGTPVEAVPTAISDIDVVTMLNKYIVVEKANYDPYEGMAVDADGNSIMVRNPFYYDVETPAGPGKYNLYGFVSIDAMLGMKCLNVCNFEYASSVAIPVINADERTEYENEANIEITSDNPEAKIYYTLDGNAPTVESTLYTGPVKVTESCTLMAIAVVGEEVSGVAVASIRILKVYEVTTLSEAKELPLGSTMIINAPMTVIFHNSVDNRDIFVTIGGENTHIYDRRKFFFQNDLPAYVEGDVIPAGARVKSYNKSGVMDFEIVGDFNAATENVGVVEPVELNDLSVLTSDDMYKYYELVDVVFTSGQTGYEVTDAKENTLAIDDTYIEIPTDLESQYKVKGFCYPGFSGLNFMPISVEKVSSAINNIVTDEVRDNRIFNLQGVEMKCDKSRLAPGIYIVGGKKILVNN